MLGHLDYIDADNYFELGNTPMTKEQLEKRQQFIQMIADGYQIGYIRVAAMDFNVTHGGTQLQQTLYVNISITGVAFYLKLRMIDDTKTLNAILNYSSCTAAKQQANRWIKERVEMAKDLNSEK